MARQQLMMQGAECAEQGYTQTLANGEVCHTCRDGEVGRSEHTWRGGQLPVIRQLEGTAPQPN